MENLKLDVDSYKDKSGNPRACYKLHCKIRGMETKADFIPKDPGGYALLEIIFNGEKSVELQVVKNKFNIDGREIESTKYFATSVDEDGQVYQLEVVPRKDSDKATMKMLLGI
jgi:hypothetical protein